jgi:FkbM family methyltransferase
MKILFVLKQTGYLRHFDTVVQTLAHQGHEIRLASQNASLTLPSTLQGLPSVSITACPKKRGDAWAKDVSLFRRAEDYLRYLEEPYTQATKLRARAFDKFIQTLSNGQRVPEPSWSEIGLELTDAEIRRLRKFFALIEDTLPSDTSIEDFVKQQAPDALLITPLVDIGSGQSDFVKSARALGIPVGMALFSWDNLSTKGSVHIAPDHVFVWNEVQQREAVELHGIRKKRISLTGAPRFDRFIDLAVHDESKTKRTEFCQALGLETDRPIILYLCSSKFVAADERPFIQSWIRDVRASKDPVVAGANLLVKTHPDLTRDWRDHSEQHVSWPGVEPALISTPFGEDRTTVLMSKFTALQTLYECLYHSDVVVGLNTSAELEAGILGKPVLTLPAGEGLEAGQRRTLHFHYLLRANGGFVELASSMDEHLTQLADVLAGRYDTQHIQSFITSFLRPQGWDKSSSKILAGAIVKHLGRKKKPSELLAAKNAVESKGEAMNGDESTNLSSAVVELDYRPHRIVINATTDAERRWRARACAKEPWTVEWIETSVNQDDVFYDIGANVGVFSLIAAVKCTKKLQVVAFEPGYASFAHLCDNIVLNQCEGVITPIPLPLSDQTGIAQFKYRSREAGQSRHALLEKTRIGPGDGQSRYQQPVLAMRLDDMVSTFNLPKPTHLKIDVDGAELRVLHGATEVLRHDGLRTILIEVETAIEDPVVAVLRDAGFSLVSRHEHGKKAKAPWYGLFARVSETGADSLA